MLRDSSAVFYFMCVTVLVYGESTAAYDLPVDLVTDHETYL